MSFEQPSSKLFGVHGVPEVLYARGTFTHSRVAQKGTRGMKRHGEPDIPRPCVKGWSGTFPFFFSNRIFLAFFRASSLSICATRQRIALTVTCEQINLASAEKKRYGNKRKENLSCRYTWCSFLVHYRIMIISILTSFAHAQYCFFVRNAPRLRCAIWQQYMKLYIMILSSFMYSICGRIENLPCEIAYLLIHKLMFL